jgi:hypothetical protein
MLYQDAGEEVISGEPFDINKLKPNVDKYTGKGNSTLYQSNFDRWLKRRDKYKSDKGKLWNGIYSSFGEIFGGFYRIHKEKTPMDNLNSKGAEFSQLEQEIAHEPSVLNLIAKLSGNNSVMMAYERTHCHLHLYRLYFSEKSQNNQRNKNSVDENAVTDLFRHYYSADTGHLSITEHKEVTAAIIAKDPVRASAALHAHIAGSREFLLKTMDVLGRP